MALSASTIATAISNLSITGMKSIRDLSNIPDELESRSLPCLFPDPSNWLESGDAASENETTFASVAASRYWVVHRGYNYVWLYKEAGDGRGLKSAYSGGSTMLDAIVTALLALNVANVDVENVTHGNLGLVTDPTGKAFIGAFINVRCRERINA